LHVVQISFFQDPSGRTSRELLRDWTSLVDVADAARLAGHRVTVIQSSPTPEVIVVNGVEYHFLPTAGEQFRALLAGLAPELVHVHGLGFPEDVIALRATMRGVPILLQDHAGRAPRWWRRGAWRRGLAAADGIAFCAMEQARMLGGPMRLDPRISIHEVPESTSRFSPGDRDAARVETGLHGEPCLLWVGHLNANKDPLTVLDGVSLAAPTMPGFHLWCCFATAPLRSAVERRIARDPNLASHVHLLGRMPHEQVQTLMRASDLFVSGSHREGSGYSVIEALATGLCPVVTDIPSFRSLVGTASDAAGFLWCRGDSRGLATALAKAWERPREKRCAAARTRFESELSFAALGRKLDSVYVRLRAGAGTR
jgi:glycosyltransferase involved in cell wall biosynthesis